MTNFGIDSQLQLGTLAYFGSPTPASMIVYFSVDQTWGRVPVPEVAAPSWHEALRRLWGLDAGARWLIGGMVFALFCIGLGLYGLLQPSPALTPLKSLANHSGAIPGH